MPSLKDFTHIRWHLTRSLNKLILQGATSESGPWHKLTKQEHQTVIKAMKLREVSKNATPAGVAELSTSA